MNKNKTIRYYLNNWIPFMDNRLRYNTKSYTIHFIVKSQTSKIKLLTEYSPFYWGIRLKPIGKNNILSKEFILLIWVRTENIKDIEDENPIGLKKNMNNGTWSDIYKLLKKIKKIYKN